MTLSNLLLILGVAAFSFSLRSFNSVLLQKLGTFGILATSFLIGWLFTGYWAVGFVLGSSWLLLPWLEILTRVRKLTLPIDKSLRHKSPPNGEVFPALDDLTHEIEGEKFEHIDDAGWDWEDYQQFFRLFYKAEDRTQAAVCLIDQNDVAFFYLSLSSRAKDGRIWTTWNYPFSYSLMLVPQWRVNRVRGDQSFLGLYESHRDFLRRNGVIAEDLEPLDAARMQDEIARDLRSQITHNLTAGVLKQNAAGEVRYSWRGLFFIWFQFLRDFVRLS
ncbi:MAG TPA: hypothetical protein VFD27_07835 [Chthoniobacteraceae bacterium]|jgi:hypothetical protein|nr:hypothetical protein [Chthoniobacteraceae bacterium]